MRIYTRIVIDMRTMEVLEEESFEYSGPIDWCKGDTEVDAAQPSASQTQYQNLTNQLLSEQLSDDQAAKPILLAEAGYTTATPSADTTAQISSLQSQRDAIQQKYTAGIQAGTWNQPDNSAMEAQMTALDNQIAGLNQPTYRPMTEDEQLANMTDAQKLQYDVTKATAQRELDALNGNLPVDPALEQSLDLSDQATKERLAQQLGPNWQSSTAGANAMQQQNQSRNITEEEARRGDITTMAGINQSNQNTNLANSQATTNDINSFDTRYLPMIGAYNAAQQPLEAQQKMQFQTNQDNAQLSQANSGGWMSMLGTLGGGGMGALSNYLKPAASSVTSAG